MPLIPRMFLRWLPLAALTVALSGLVYLAVQQVGRHTANDPQIQMARDIAATLGSGGTVESVVAGAPVDIGRSLSPFVTIYNGDGTVVASSGRLHGEARSVPPGVLTAVRKEGEVRVTWQPEPGVRIATVLVRQPGTSGGVVLVGRSLEETEQRAAQFLNLVTLACVAVLLGLFVVVAASELALARGTP